MFEGSSSKLMQKLWLKYVHLKKDEMNHKGPGSNRKRLVFALSLSLSLHILSCKYHQPIKLLYNNLHLLVFFTGKSTWNIVHNSATYFTYGGKAIGSEDHLLKNPVMDVLACFGKLWFFKLEAILNGPKITYFIRVWGITNMSRTV